MRMDVRPVHLTGQIVRLDPLDREHAPSLYHHGDPGIFAYLFVRPEPHTLTGYQRYIEETLERPSSCAFAVVLRDSGAAIGVTTYIDIRPEHRGLEIGSTWIARQHQGTRVNPEMKYLMSRHAFEELAAVRVQLKTDGRNVQSQRAIAKLGAIYEGTLRKHLILPDGYVRDTVMYSITDAEWPQVKAGLEARLGYIP